MLADAAGISRSTINDFERKARRPMSANLAAMVGAFEKAEVRFTEEGCICPPPVKEDAEPEPETAEEPPEAPGDTSEDAEKLP